MKRTVQVFVIPAARAPEGPPDPPREVEVEAADIDELPVATRQLLEAEGLRVRVVSFAPGGLVAYAEERR